MTRCTAQSSFRLAEVELPSTGYRIVSVQGRRQRELRVKRTNCGAMGYTGVYREDTMIEVAARIKTAALAAMDTAFIGYTSAALFEPQYATLFAARQ